MLSRLRKPQVDLAALILRLGLAAIFIVHGVVKLQHSTPLVPEITRTTQTVVGWVELAGGIALAAGLLSRLAALANAAVQVGAIILVTGKYAFDVPGVTRTGLGAEYHKVGPEFNMALIAMCLGVALLGSGVVSLDHLLVSLFRRGKAQPAAKADAQPAAAGSAV
jgi:putative oxidoreductase